MTLPAVIRQDVISIGADTASGATALLLWGIGILRAAAGDRGMLEEVAAALCAAQPSMAGFRTAAALVGGAADPVEVLDGLAARVGRAPAAIARVAVPLVRLRRPVPGHHLRIVTCSRSAAVEQTLLELARAEPLHVACSESLPAREGVGLAQALAAAGVVVEVYTDAGVGSALESADALLVGADAVSSGGYINKVGTAGLAALARVHGVSVLVLAGREKILPPEVFAALPLREGSPADVLPGSTGYRVRNPLFERIPTAIPADVVTESGGPLPLDAVGSACLW